MTIEAQRADRDRDDHHRDKLIDRVMRAIGPAYDGAAELQNRAFAGKLVSALLALHVLREHSPGADETPADRASRSTEQDQPKKQKEQRDPVS